MATLIHRESRVPVRRYDAALDPFHIIDSFFGGEVFAPLATRTAPRAFEPRFEVRETKDAYVFKADVPGVAEKDIEIQLTGNVLAISGERKQESSETNDRYFAFERTYGKFSRSFSLPEGVDGEHVTAEVKDGVLTLSVPKKPEVQPRRIPVGAPPASPAKA